MSRDEIADAAFTAGYEARAAVPQDRASIERQAAYYFSEIRKFSPLNLDHYSMENWKDFIVWRAAAPQAPPERIAPVIVVAPSNEELAESIAYRIKSLLSEKYTNTCKIAFGVIKQELDKSRAAAVPKPGETGK